MRWMERKKRRAPSKQPGWLRIGPFLTSLLKCTRATGAGCYCSCSSCCSRHSIPKCDVHHDTTRSSAQRAFQSRSWCYRLLSIVVRADAASCKSPTKIQYRPLLAGVIVITAADPW
ncbi:hypothetical protein F4679DRAFT_424350 [Xylaria curta]|nr:hypothetical protein F4679DRAFT_424350 [Xylaria curta]